MGLNIYNPLTKTVEKFDHNLKDPKKLVKKYTKKVCKKSQKVCQRQVHVLFETGNVKVYKCVIRKIAKPKEVEAVDTVKIVPKRKISVSYVKSYTVNK